MKATTIDQVIEQLDAIILTEKQNNSSLAFFPILYNRVTKRIKAGIEAEEFYDNARMEQLDVIFANRYIEAYQHYKAGNPPTESWFNAFKISEALVMQHLLLGINAHINLDLGIAAAETTGAHALADFEQDFNKINEVLAAMVADVKAAIGKVSPLFKLLELVGKGKEDKLVSFSINIARDGAWLFANQYAAAVEKEEAIADRDQVIAALAVQLVNPKSKLLQVVAKVVRFFEVKDVQSVAAILER
ncbi:DUF5995 family protein [Leeuwenhoekiella palythoae]|uniref:Uncharacterized protein n=1 Tax=Leeuwenhoekiella palythoae TaxID=573501 RepID=A0A1M5YY37_9FLAO|nr:DUF5995 family protein [Leeuwenhoekiella palythoae]RXG29646.1 hypothetical protein DSM01_1748 [Leeuwenhoekiella palythoae]SHI16774.1 hypothetical protein SAMN04487999_2472 [Leeuwenhoekiella palythoae]